MTTQTFLDLVKECATEKTITVYETDNFDIFKLNRYNREISQAKVAKFMEQDLKDVIYPVNCKGEILDGQHRIMACKALNQKVRFMIIDNADERYIHNINTVGSVWTTANFVDYYAAKKQRDYELLKFYVNSPNHVVLASVGALLSGEKVNLKHGHTRTQNKIVKGIFQIVTNPTWVMTGYNLAKELHDQINFASQEKQINKFKQSFIEFCIVLQYWGYLTNRSDVIDKFKINMLLELGNLAKYINQEKGNSPAVFEKIFNKNKKQKLDYVQASKSYFQAVESGEIRKMVEPELQRVYEEICNQSEETKEE